jgi:SOS-response transcriptional repressor LexA
MANYAFSMPRKAKNSTSKPYSPNRLKEHRKNKNMTLQEFAEEVSKTVGTDVPYQTIQKYENSERRLSLDWIKIFADVLEINPEDLFFGEGQEQKSRPSGVRPALKKVDIIAPVQAGVWTESFEYPVGKRKQVYLSDAAPDMEYFAVEVVGESMNLLYPEGTILICVSPYETKILDGDSVIVQRVRDDEYETTVKVLKIEEATGRAYLLPKSSHPDHQTPVTIPWPFVGGRDPKTGIERVEIIGVVVESHLVRKRRL